MLDEQHSELNNIILNREARDGKRTKILVVVGALALILIIIVVTMGMMEDDTPNELPSIPSSTIAATEVMQPDTEERVIVNDGTPMTYEEVAEDIAVASPQNDIVFIDEEKDEPEAKPKSPVRVNPAVKPTVRVSTEVRQPQKVQPKPAPVERPAVVPASNIYIQVGSFSRLEPNKSFIGTIESNGYTYRYYRVVSRGKSVNKVLIGPYASRAEAKKALPGIRSSIESGAFIYTIKQ